MNSLYNKPALSLDERSMWHYSMNSDLPRPSGHTQVQPPVGVCVAYPLLRHCTPVHPLLHPYTWLMVKASLNVGPTLLPIRDSNSGCLAVKGLPSPFEKLCKMYYNIDIDHWPIKESPNISHCRKLDAHGFWEWSSIRKSSFELLIFGSMWRQFTIWWCKTVTSISMRQQWKCASVLFTQAL